MGGGWVWANADLIHPNDFFYFPNALSEKSALIQEMVDEAIGRVNNFLDHGTF